MRRAVSEKSRCAVSNSEYSSGSARIANWRAPRSMLVICSMSSRVLCVTCTALITARWLLLASSWIEIALLIRAKMSGSTASAKPARISIGNDFG